MKTNARARAGRERERAKKNAEGALSLSDDDAEKRGAFF